MSAKTTVTLVCDVCEQPVEGKRRAAMHVRMKNTQSTEVEIDVCEPCWGRPIADVVAAYERLRAYRPHNEGDYEDGDAPESER